MERKDFSFLMDEIICRKLLPGNCAQEPKKEVRVMFSADFEDSCIPEEKFFHYTPLPLDLLPPFRLCAAVYWEKNNEMEEQMAAKSKNFDNTKAIEMAGEKLKLL